MTSDCGRKPEKTQADTGQAVRSEPRPVKLGKHTAPLCRRPLSNDWPMTQSCLFKLQWQSWHMYSSYPSLTQSTATEQVTPRSGDLVSQLVAESMLPKSRHWTPNCWSDVSLKHVLSGDVSHFCKRQQMAIGQGAVMSLVHVIAGFYESKIAWSDTVTILTDEYIYIVFLSQHKMFH